MPISSSERRWRSPRFARLAIALTVLVSAFCHGDGIAAERAATRRAGPPPLAEPDDPAHVAAAGAWDARLTKLRDLNRPAAERPDKPSVGADGPRGFATFAPRIVDGRVLVLTSSLAAGGHRARLWDARTGQALAVLDGYGARLCDAAFDRDGRRIITASDDHRAIVWSLGPADSVRPTTVLAGHEAPVTHAEFSPDGRYALTASDDGTSRVWDLRRGHPQILVPERIGRRHPGPVTAARFGPEGLRLVTAVADGTSWLWEEKFLSPGFELETRLDAGGPRIAAVDFSPDGGAVLTAPATPRGAVNLWSVITGRLIGTLAGHEAPVTAARFAGDGRWIVTGSEDGTARVWDAVTRQTLAVLQGHKGGVAALDVAARDGGLRIATGGRDGTVRLWDGLTGRELAAAPAADTGITRVEFGPDGQLLLSVAQDGLVTLWQA